MHPAELAANRRLTEAFIDADPVVLSIVIPGQKTPDGEGGWVTTPALTISAKGRLIPQSDKVPVLATSEGFRPRPEFVLMVMPETQLAKGATFKLFGKGWRIDQLHLKPDYELKGDVFQDG